MYETIREKIRENRVAEALKDMDALQLSREHTSRLVNLHRRYRVYQEKAISNLSEERLLRIEENGIVEDILTFLDMVEFPAKYEQEKEGGVAGAAERTKEQGKKAGLGRWVLLVLGLAVMALLAFWVLQPDDKPTPVNPTTEQPERTEDPDKPERPTLTNPRIPDGKVTLNPDVLDRVELKPATDLKLDPNILSRALLLKPFMTEGKQVPMALAVYYNKKSPTEYNETMTRQMGAFVRSFLQREISMDVLTKAFHESDVRERMVLRATSDEDKRLKVERTPYLLLLDIRSEARNKGSMRICLYDVSRQKGFTRGKSVLVRDGKGNIAYGEMAAFVREFLTELRERGLFK
ncbi:hypothetical protein [Neolewinella persica]|uniref:hypothetical protein n=1 Tax=Neolewinella persica TaxID=70998 RepID=UPI00037ACB9B|nr:hypothetical protein [Neolewinella persica]